MIDVLQICAQTLLHHAVPTATEKVKISLKTLSFALATFALLQQCALEDERSLRKFFDDGVFAESW